MALRGIGSLAVVMVVVWVSLALPIIFYLPEVRLQVMDHVNAV